MTFKPLLATLAIAVLAHAAPAKATSITVDEEDRGRYINGNHLNASVFQDYTVGKSGGIEFRDWFSFDFGGVSGTLVSAQLKVWTGTSGYSSPDSSETYQLNQVTTNPNALGHTGNDSAVWADL